MKIIDTHTHLPGRCLGAAPRPIEDIRAEFERAGLCEAWIMTVDGLLRDPAPNNDLLAAAVERHRDFFVPFATVNPHDGAEAAVRELERCVHHLGMKGLKLHPWLQSFSLTHAAVLPILRRTGELGLPVLFHDGSPPYSDPLQIAAAAEQAPDTAIILGHAGLDDLYGDAILACLRHSNIYLCCCSLSSGYIAEIVRRCPPERLLFGSDGGFAPNTAEMAIEKILEADAPEALQQQIFYDNPCKLIPRSATAV